MAAGGRKRAGVGARFPNALASITRENCLRRVRKDRPMRCFRTGLAIIAACVLALAACSDRRPPVGRWEGLYQAGDAMIAARLEIAPNGVIRASAPNAFMDFTAMNEDQRAAMRGRLESELARAWPAVAAIELEFDGTTFRKPGGVAPQLEWDGSHMAMMVYPGTHPSIRVPLVAVEEFGDSVRD
jgi:hypothetical protein